MKVKVFIVLEADIMQKYHKYLIQTTNRLYYTNNDALKKKFQTQGKNIPGLLLMKKYLKTKLNFKKKNYSEEKLFSFSIMLCKQNSFLFMFRSKSVTF